MKARIPLKDRIIVALDAPSLKEAGGWLETLDGITGYYKIGLELFTAHGWKAVDLVRKRGGKIFLDLKLHDIPNTVSRALRPVCEHGVEMVNLHALGGFEMMKKAREAVDEFSKGKKRPKLLAVTILTSHDQKTLTNELGIRRRVKDQVLHLAKLAKRAGLDGIVCSPQEISRIRAKLGRKFLIITPGVRPSGSGKGDQKRVETPERAICDGADHLVIGRPITRAGDPRKTALDILRSISVLD